MGKKRRRNVARDKILDQMLGRALLTSEAVRKEFMDRLVDAIVDVGWNDEQSIVAVVRTYLAAYEPLLAEHLSNAMILTWLGGYIEQAKHLPTVVQRWMRDHAFWAQLPPEVPGIFGTGDKSPREVRFPRIEKAVETLFKRGLMTRPQYDNLSAAAKQATFTVAWIDDTKVIGKIRDALAEVIDEGPTLARFREKVVEKLETSPMSKWHSETVYRTNLMSAYRDGKESLLQHPIVQEVFPFREYFATHDGRVRDDHLALETMGIQGTGIYYSDDPVWDHFSVPWDYNCRCVTVPMRIADAARAGIEEAKQWLATGVRPANPTYCLDKIPFRPKEGFGMRHGPLLSVGTASSVRMSSQPVRMADVNPWQPYRGPRDGQGWKNLQTGNIVYQVERPGERETGAAEQPAEQPKPPKPPQPPKPAAQAVKPPARPHVTDTPEFKTWFGGSKVTGDDGKPLVVYHGTGSDIEEFNTGVAWVSRTPELANEYAAHREVFDKQAANVMPLYVRAETPWSYDGAKHASIHTMMGRALSDAKQAGHAVDMKAAREAYKAVDEYWEKIGLDDSEVEAHKHWNMSGKEGASLLGKFLQTLGFDSIRFMEGKHETFGVFSPSQIKSATGNRGKFDPSNPDIRMGDVNPWVPYKGPRGGTGWRHSQTGNIAYQVDRPGVHEVAGIKEETATAKPTQIQSTKRFSPLGKLKIVPHGKDERGYFYEHAEHGKLYLPDTREDYDKLPAGTKWQDVDTGEVESKRKPRTVDVYQPSEKATVALRDLRKRLPRGYASWVKTDGVVENDSEDVDNIQEYLEREHGIRVRDDGLIEFERLTPVVKKIVGDRPIIVHQHTSDAILDRVRKHGLLPAGDGRAAANPYLNTKAGVYVTTETSGPVVDGYREIAVSKHGGKAITLEIKTTIGALRDDPDDKDLDWAIGRQFILPRVAPNDIVNLNTVSRMAVSDVNPWSPYKGPRGGTGWQHSGTGDVRYVKDRPGAHETGGASKAGVHGVSPLPVQGPHKPGGVVRDSQRESTAASQALPQGAQSRVGSDVSGVVPNQRPEASVIADMLQRTKSAGLEHGALFDSSGKQIGETVAGRKKETDGFGHQGVQITTTADHPDGMTKVHTHPGTERPSKADYLDFFGDTKLARSMIVLADGSRWEMTRTKETGDISGYDIKQAWMRAEEDLIIDDGLDPKDEQFTARMFAKLEPLTGVRVEHVKEAPPVFQKADEDIALPAGHRSASEVLSQIKSSPQFRDREVDWDRYAERWGVTGEFYEINIPAEALLKLAESQRLGYSSGLDSERSQADIQEKLSDPSKRNPVVITAPKDERTPLMVLDGTHSLAAWAKEFRSAKGKDQANMTIPVVISADAAKWAGVAPPAVQHVTETPEFKQWFGKSKITGKDGKPLVIYTGQSPGLSEIPKTERSEFPVGHAFFTTDKQVASQYAGTHENEVSGKTDFSGGRKGKVYPVYLSIQRPFECDEFDEDEWAKHLLPDIDVDSDGYSNRDLADALKLDRLTEYDEARDRNVTIGYETPGGSYLPTDFSLDDAAAVLWKERSGQGDTLQDAIAKSPSAQLLAMFPETGMRYIDTHGFDGIVFSDAEMGGTTIVPFSPSQIKMTAEP